MAPLLRKLQYTTLGFGGKGALYWNPEHPMAISVDDFGIDVDTLRSVINASVDFTQGCMVNEFRLAVTDIPVDALLRHVPTNIQPIPDA